MKDRSRKRGEVTLIELLEVIAAIAIGAWLAETVSIHFQGASRKVVFWVIATVGSGVIFLCLLVGLGYLFEFGSRRKRNKAKTGEIKDRGQPGEKQ